MKRILIVDPISPIGHINYNYGIIKAAEKNYAVDIFVSSEMREALLKKGISNTAFIQTFSSEYAIEKLANRYKNKIVYHFLYRKHLLENYKVIKQLESKYDAVLLTSVDVYSFAIISHVFKGNILVVDHAVGMINDSRLYRDMWMMTNNQIKLIVMERFIKEMVQRNGINKQCYIVHHPLPEIQDTGEKLMRPDGNRKITIFAPSASNDDSFIERLKSLTKRDDLQIIAKGKRAYQENGVQIYNTRLSQDEYDRILKAADYILLPYQDDYNYRISAVLFEAAVCNKKVLLRNNNTLREYKKLFPKQVILFNTREEMAEIVKNNTNLECPTFDLKQYEIGGIAEALRNAIGVNG